MIDQSSDSRKAKETLCSYVMKIDIAACFSASKSNAKSPSEESIFFILSKGMH